MKTILGIFLLTGFLIVCNASESWPIASTQSTNVQENFWKNQTPAELTYAPDDLKATIGNRQLMEQYLATNSATVYTSWLKNNLASSYRNSGRITPALEDWSNIWQQLKNATDTESYNQANHALAGQLELLTMLGRVETLPELLKETQTRVISDPQDRQRIQAAWEGYTTMFREPGLNYRCGTLALAEIARMEGKSESVIAALVGELSPKEGISLLRLVQLSRQYDLGLVAVKRTDKTPLPVPCIVHWAQNHYGALLEYNSKVGCYRTIFDEPKWMAAPDVDAEQSGYFLISASQRPASWPIVSDAECAKVLGRSYIYTMNDSKDKGCKVNPANPKATCPTCPTKSIRGMPAWWVTEPYINLFLADEPVSYTTSRGENLAFRVTVKQRDSLGTVFTYPRPGLLHNWYSRVFIQGMPLTVPQYVTNNITHQVTTNYVAVAETNGFSSWTATVDLPTGGQVVYNSSTNWSSSYDEETKTTLLPAYGKLSDGTQYPIPGFPIGGTGVAPDWNDTPPVGSSTEYGYQFWNDAASGFRVVHSDGSIDRFGVMCWEANPTTGFYEAEALLTQRTDPLGNDVNLNYEFYTNQTSGAIYFRLKNVVDYDGNTNKFTYFANNPGILKQITTAYNQTAIFAYDNQGNLTNITDAVTNSSGFTWDANGRVSALKTPYGTTTFSYYDADLPGTNNSFLNGDIPVNRSITVTDPNGGVSIYAYCFNSQNVTPSQFTNAPQNTPLGTLDTGTNTVDHTYAAASFRNSFYWDTRQTATLSTMSVSNMTSSDFLKARMQHWLGDANNVTQTELLSVEQEPSPNGTTAGQLTFYDYYGKTLKYLQGTNSQVAVIARRQPSGLTEYDWKQYNSDGFVTKDISTYVLADGVVRTRTNTFIYATNTISFNLYNDLTGYPVVTPQPYYLNDGCFYYNSYTEAVPCSPLFDVTETSGGTCGAWSAYNASTSTVSIANLLVASIDASGATNKYGGYTTLTQTNTVHTYTAWYNPTEPSFNGNLTADYTWNQAFINTFTVPLPTKITNAVGYITTIIYNANNQIKSVKSPAGLTTTNTYNASGFLTKVIDIEIGRTNSFTYTNGLIYTWQNERGLTVTNNWDKLQRLVSQADREGVITYVYSKLDLTALQDKLGNWTYYGYDPLQHLIAITNANQEVTLASYCSCGALNWSRDPMGNYTYYNYDNAGRLTSIQYPDGYSVTNTYDALDQLVKSSDGLGYVTNSYNLQGLVTASANAIGIIRSNSYDIVDRPQSVTDNRGVTTTLSYDAIDRVLTNIVAGITTNSFVYTVNGLSQVADGLRTNLTRFQNDVLGRVLSRTNANNEVVQMQYDASGNLTNLLDGKSQKTIFQLDSFGRLTNKLDNTSTSVLRLTYDANGQILTRWTPEKGTTTFIRDSVGRVRTNSYPLNPQIVFYYDRDGRLTNMVDGIGSTLFTYSAVGQLQSEGGIWANDTVTRLYNNRLRSSLTLNSQITSYSFDSGHRLNSISGVGGSFGYTYNPGIGGSYSSPLVQKLSLPYGMSITNGYDLAGRLTATVLLNSNLVSLDSEKYSYDADSQRTLETRYDNSTVTYTYDRIGQLKGASAKEAGSTTRLNEQFGYVYDAAGNLSSRTNNTLTLTFNANSVNQITNSTRSGTLTAAGNTAQATTSVKVNGQNSALYGDNTFATTAGLNLANGANTFTTVVQYATKTLTNTVVSQLPTPVAYLYDANGNLTNDGLRSLSYDDENQLINVTVAGQWKSDFLYDGLGRRRIARDYTWNGSWALTNEIHYIFDGKLVIQERDTNNYVIATYDRGLDLAGDLQDAGGIGGLLARTDIKGTIYYHSDALGNITMLVDRYQTLEGRYLYDPFGNIVGKWGPYADVNRYRFSSKEFLPLSGLYNFGGRFYDPNLQRFINRDPMGELGGLNLYVYVGNSPILYIDPFGFLWYDDLANYVGNSAAQAKDIVNNSLPPVAATALDTAIDLGNGLASTPAAIGHLGEGSGTFSADPSWENAAGLAQDVSTAAGVLAGGLEGVPSAKAPLGNSPLGLRPPTTPKAPKATPNRPCPTEKPASTPVGRSGKPLGVASPKGVPANTPANISGRDYTGHALDQMQSRGIPPSAVENTVQHGLPTPGNQPGSTVYYDPVNDLSAVVDTASGRVITVHKGQP